LLDATGRSLGDGLTPLEIHVEVSRVFGNQALPDFAREAVADLQRDQKNPEAYPPDPIPETSLSINAPSEVRAGSSRAVSVTWDGDAFTVESFFAELGGLRAGVIDAGNGAWLLLPIPDTKQPTEAALTVGGTDRYGQSLVGQSSITILPDRPNAPVEVSKAFYEHHGKNVREQEARALAQLASVSMGVRRPMWSEPFRMPADGEVVREFGQKVVTGVLRPAHPCPGLELRMPHRSAVSASNSGRVALVESLPLRGRTVGIIHGGGLVTVYAGLDSVAVELDQQVGRGQTLGHVGSGRGGGRLRWEIHVSGVPVDPVSWLDAVLPRN
jgi:murein DD-endopeptidase MepM/ murein hydrolase activator NlpD